MVEAYGDRPERAGQLPFVGRAAEVRLLDSVLDGLKDGGLAIVDVTGEAGIGKSRLLAQFGARIRSRGMTVLSGQASEYEQHSLFRPFADAFADLSPAVLRRFPALAELSPALRGVTDTPAAPGGGNRFALYQATAALLGRLGPHGLAVVLDDLHWADPASLELLDHLARHPVSSPLLLVVSRRGRQTPPVLSTSLARGVDSGVALRITLGPLPERDCVEGLAADLPLPRASELYAASDGNPLYFLTLLQAHRDARKAPGRSSPVAGRAVSGEPDGLPVGLGALLLDELAALSPLERRVLEAATVLGDQSTPRMIGVLTGSGSEEVIHALRGLMQRDLLRRGHGGRLALRHPLVRELIHENIDPWLREDFHRRASAEIAAAGATVIEQAYHVERSVTCWDPQAADVLVAAAEQSAATAPAASAHWLGIVLRLLPNGSEHLAARRELTLFRARALGVSGGLQEGRDLLQQVMDMPAPDRYDDIRAAAATLRGQLERQLGRHQEAEAMLRRELARTPGPSASHAVRIGLELCSCVLSAARYPRARADINEVLAAARSLGDVIGELGALARIALGEAYEGDLGTARTVAASAAALARTLADSDVAELCESLCTLGWTEAFLEDYSGADGHLDRGLEIARRTGQAYLVPQFLTAKAYIHFSTCRITSALELAEEAEPMARTVGSDELLAFTLAFQSQILQQAGRPAPPNALAVAEEAAAAAGGNDRWWATLAQCMLASAALDAGDPHRATDILLRAGGGSDLRRLQPTTRPNCLEILSGAALAVGDTDAAVRWAERARKEAEQLGLPAQRGAARRSLGRIAAYHGDSATAARMFTAAAEQSVRSRATLREAQSLLLAAPHLRATGDSTGAAEMWHRGARLASEGGAHLLTGLAESIQPVVFAAPAEPADELVSLTSREREVAELVAEGLTSAAIADKLVLSPRTVESHIARIYRKTGVSSRAALAVIVSRNTGPQRAYPQVRRPAPEVPLPADGPAAGHLSPLTPRAVADTPRLLGRDAELDSLTRMLEDLKAGVGRAVVLVGEPGIGKSSLLWTASAHARAQGVPVLAARGTHPPLPPLPPPLSAGPDIVDVYELAARADDRSAVMAVVDDLHDLAPERIADVERLLAATVTGPALCLMAYRQRRLSSPLAAVLARASSAGLLEVWNLGPLSPEQARELLGDRPDLEELHGLAGGNPQYLKVLAADGGTAADAGTAILGELDGLDAVSLTVVQVAAVLGDSFHPELLSAVADLDPSAAMAAVDRLTRLDLVRPTEPAPRLSLRHRAVADVVYERLEPSRRLTLHRRAEAELARRAAPIAERAYHVARAADPWRPEHATTLIAAARGMLYSAPAVATGHLQAALSLLQEGGTHWYEAKVLLARARLLTGDAAEAKALLEALRSDIPGGPADGAPALADSSRVERRMGRYPEAGALARAGLAALTEDDSATAAALYAELADHAYDVQDYETSRQHAETAAGLARAHRDPVGEVNALGKAALGHLFAGDQATALATLARATDILDTVPDTMLVASLEAVQQVGLTEGMMGRLADSERHLARGSDLSRRTGQTYIHPHLLTFLGNARLRTGNLSGALSTLDEADRDVGRIRDPAGEAILMMLRAEALLWRAGPGDLAEATAAAERARAAADSRPTAWAVSVRCFHAEFVLLTGDPAGAGWQLLDVAGGEELPRLTAWRRPRWCDLLAHAAATSGGPASVERWARLAEESVAQLPSVGRQGFALRARLRAHAVYGDTDSALSCAQDAIADFADAGDRIELVRTLLTAATVSLDAGRTDAVGGWLRRAAVLADQCGSARLAADAAGLLARLAAGTRESR
ncbi:AAA family ATPase [Kitasatospora mediocidica]|uniref:AAA family ATPase n=1 Tax=Kitasatospora mediocidica TaxID=58352 RepID=UPI0007C7103E|nr:AAA family ATPase [Kitasatospora mediocidica]